MVKVVSRCGGVEEGVECGVDWIVYKKLNLYLLLELLPSSVNC